jgi:CheY-like chemotaxis protein
MRPTPYILIADDDPLVLKSIRFLLEKSGFTIEAVSDGQQALDRIREKKPVLALLDVMMPRMTGLDVCRAVKEDPELRDVTIYLVTARAMTEEREIGFAAGADDYITKPFVNKELIERVRTVFELALTS